MLHPPEPILTPLEAITFALKNARYSCINLGFKEKKFLSEYSWPDLIYEVTWQVLILRIHHYLDQKMIN